MFSILFSFYARVNKQLKGKSILIFQFIVLIRDAEYSSLLFLSRENLLAAGQYQHLSVRPPETQLSINTLCLLLVETLWDKAHPHYPG